MNTRSAARRMWHGEAMNGGWAGADVHVGELRESLATRAVGEGSLALVSHGSHLCITRLARTMDALQFGAAVFTTLARHEAADQRGTPSPAVEADGRWLDRAEDSREPLRPRTQTVRMSFSGTIIIVNFNSGECLTRCLESIEVHAPAANVIVIDNASTDGSTGSPALRRDAVSLQVNPQQRGFRAGRESRTGGDVPRPGHVAQSGLLPVAWRR